MSRTSSLPDLLTHLNERKAMTSTYNDVLEIFGGTVEKTDKKPDYKFAPEGDNVAVIKDAGVSRNDRGEYLFIRFLFPSTNSEETSFQNLPPQNDGARKALAAQFGSLGLQPSSASSDDLHDEIRKAIGWTVNVTKKSKKGSKKNKDGKDVWFRNFYIKSVLNRGVEPKEQIEEDEIPF